MRCLALAQQWKKEGCSVMFLISPDGLPYADHLSRNGIGFSCCNSVAGSAADTAETLHFLRDSGAECIVMDGYRFDSVYVRKIRESGAVTVLFDDYGHASHNYSDFVINQNIFASDKNYTSSERYTQLLLGSKFYLIREEFRLWPDRKKKIAKIAKNILLTLGASDPDNLTMKVLNAILPGIPDDCRVRVVIGAGNPHIGEIRDYAEKHLENLEVFFDAKNMPELMAWADIAVSAAGTTACELAYMGTPMALITTSDNQIPVSNSLYSRSAAVSLGDKSSITADNIQEIVSDLIHNRSLRQTLADNAITLIDGQGACRAIRKITETWIRLQPAVADDCKRLWLWVNDPVVRASAFNTDIISFEDHISWFTQKQADPSCVQYIASDMHGEAIGQIRFDTDDSGYVNIDVSVDPKHRGKGRGASIIRTGIRQHYHTHKPRGYYSLIKPENISSIRSFERAGFRQSTPHEDRKLNAIRLTYLAL